MFPIMKDPVSFHPIIDTDMKDLTSIFLSIDIKFHFPPQCINEIQEKTAWQKWNWLLDAAVKILKYKKSTIDYAIYIKILYYGTLSYLTVSTDDVLNTNNK